MIEPAIPSRRKFLQNVGYISVGFSMFGGCIGKTDPAIAARFDYLGDLPRSMNQANQVNAWLEVSADGRVRVFSGKVELGQGIRVAVQMVAAEELDMELDKVTVHLAETDVTPNEGYTAGSGSIKSSAMSVRYAAATARTTLLQLASIKLELPIENLALYNGVIRSTVDKKSVTIQDLLEGAQIETEVKSPVQIKSKEDHKYVGKAIPREDIKKMVLGEQVYIQDLRFPGMVHARVVRPPNYRSELEHLDDSELNHAVPGIIKTVINGNFVGVIAEREYQAVKAARYLEMHSKWTTPEIFPAQEKLYDHIRNIAETPENIRDDGDVRVSLEQGRTLKATYTKPYIKHGSMGPGCAVALYHQGILHVWSNSQGIYPLREALAAMLKMDTEKIHIVSVPGAGCYGHSTPDDAAADACLLALDYPGKHIRVQWSRADEHAWEPYGSAIIADLEASLTESGKIGAWKSDIWTDSHSTRPNKDPGTLLAARYLENPMEMQSRGYRGGGHRNGDPYYAIPNLQLNAYYYDGPLRVTSLRSLGAFANIFAIESFMDELADKAGKDPLEFRLEHLEDQRAIAVIQKVKDLTADQVMAAGTGLGYAFGRYKNNDAYVAIAVKLAVDGTSGQVSIIKMWAAIDVGEVINLDGIKNQTEGGMIQAASWTLNEQVTFDQQKITSTDWSTYPILRFNDIPEVEVAVIDRPHEPVLGGGEAAGPPTGAAIANAIFRACGKRIYDLPVTPGKISS
ncbi:MAG: aldehyde dehydrogenase [Cyclobacteriaceae bacterium]|nr:MAG: aldehyde dehydrogenase [Cyclobacteriaceae bacterium]